MSGQTQFTTTPTIAPALPFGVRRLGPPHVPFRQGVSLGSQRPLEWSPAEQQRLTPWQAGVQRPIFIRAFKVLNLFPQQVDGL